MDVQVIGFLFVPAASVQDVFVACVSALGGRGGGPKEQTPSDWHLAI